MREPFHLASGGILRDEKDLLEALAVMDDAVFGKHVRTDKNDFADWLEGSLWRSDLAAAVRPARTPADCALRLRDALRPKDSVDESSFEGFRQQRSDQLDAVSDRFDAFMKRLRDRQSESGSERDIQIMEERYRSIRDAVSDARKKGHDPLVASFLLRQVPPKLAFAKSSGAPTDLQQVARLLDDVKRELDEELARKEVDVKAEIAARVAAMRNSEKDGVRSDGEGRGAATGAATGDRADGRADDGKT